MKRSELLKDIEEFEELYHDIITAEDAFDVEYVIDKIISRAESLGMLPPSRPATPNDIINITQEFIDEHGFTENSWDEEL